MGCCQECLPTTLQPSSRRSNMLKMYTRVTSAT